MRYNRLPYRFTIYSKSGTASRTKSVKSVKGGREMKYKDVELENIHVALGCGILFGIGLISGWYLTVSGFF